MHSDTKQRNILQASETVKQNSYQALKLLWSIPHAYILTLSGGSLFSPVIVKRCQTFQPCCYNESCFKPSAWVGFAVRMKLESHAAIRRNDFTWGTTPAKPPKWLIWAAGKIRIKRKENKRKELKKKATTTAIIRLGYPYNSLRSKRFRGFSEQKKSEERDFRSFGRAKNGARAKKWERGEGGEEGEETLADKPQDFENSCPLSHFLLSPLKTYALGMDHNILKAWYEFCFTSLQFALAPFFARLKLRKFRSSDFFCSENPTETLATQATPTKANCTVSVPISGPKPHRDTP